MLLAVGKPTIRLQEVDEFGNRIGKKFVIDTPKENTTNLEGSPGDKKEFIEEGGAVIDSYQKKSKYTLKWENFGKKGREKPVPDMNGVITKQYAVEVIPEDPTCLASRLHRVSLACNETWSTEEGVLWKYEGNVLLSPDYEDLWEYFYANEEFELDKDVLFFKSAGESLDVEADVSESATLSGELCEKYADVDWVSAEAEGNLISFTAKPNEGPKRECFFDIKTDDGRHQIIKISQKAGN